MITTSKEQRSNQLLQVCSLLKEVDLGQQLLHLAKVRKVLLPAA